MNKLAIALIVCGTASASAQGRPSHPTPMQARDYYLAPNGPDYPAPGYTYASPTPGAHYDPEPFRPEPMPPSLQPAPPLTTPERVPLGYVSVTAPAHTPGPYHLAPRLEHQNTRALRQVNRQLRAKQRKLNRLTRKVTQVQTRLSRHRYNQRRSHRLRQRLENLQSERQVLRAEIRQLKVRKKVLLGDNQYWSDYRFRPTPSDYNNYYY